MGKKVINLLQRAREPLVTGKKMVKYLADETFFFAHLHYENIYIHYMSISARALPGF